MAATVQTQPACQHCGSPVPLLRADDPYCCEGCAYVARLLRDEGLERYYDLRDRVIAPPRLALGPARDYTWLDEKQAEAEVATPARASLKLEVQGLSCIGCVWLLEKLFRRMPGALLCEVNVQTGQLRLEWLPGQLRLSDYAREVERFGYLLGPAGERVAAESQRLMTRLAPCAAFALNAMLFSLPRYLGMEADFLLADLFDLLALVFATLSLLVGGSYFISRAIRALRRGVLHIDLPIALGVSLAYAGSLTGWFLQQPSLVYFDFVSIFMFLMLGGRWLQERSVERNRNQLLARHPTPLQLELAASPAGPFTRQPVENLRPGQSLRVPPGGLFPVASRLESDASLSLEWINGEAEPRLIAAGQAAPAGAMNLGRETLTATALESWSQSLLAKLMAHSERAFRHPGLERLLRVYIAVILAIALLGGLAWAFAGQGLTGLQAALSVLVVSCPCAVGVAFPLAHELAVTRLRRQGVFVKEESLFNRLPELRRIVFDKTGTLTLETPRLLNPDALTGLDPTERAALFALVSDSLHPVGRALAAHLRAQGLNSGGLPPAIEEFPGRGQRLTSPTGRYALGRADWAPAASRGDDAAPSGTPLGSDAVFAREGRVLATFSFSDALRADAPAVVADLRRDFPLYILSGDRPDKVQAMAAALDLPSESALASLSPEAKAAWVDAQGPGTLFIGDGANDSLAFDRATVRGTPVIDRGLLEHKADFYFLGHELGGLRHLLAEGRRRTRAFRQVFGFAVTYNVVAVSLALAGLMSPLLAAILMPLSSIVTLAIAAWNFR